MFEFCAGAKLTRCECAEWSADDTAKFVWIVLDAERRTDVDGLPKGQPGKRRGGKAEALKDYDTALDEYNKALQKSPNNTEYRLKADRARFEAAQWHVGKGRTFRQQGNLELALAEFRKAQMIDPSSAVAEQEVRATMEAMGAKQGTSENMRRGTLRVTHRPKNQN